MGSALLGKGVLVSFLWNGTLAKGFQPILLGILHILLLEISQGLVFGEILRLRISHLLGGELLAKIEIGLVVVGVGLLSQLLGQAGIDIAVQQQLLRLLLAWLFEAVVLHRRISLVWTWTV